MRLVLVGYCEYLTRALKDQVAPYYRYVSEWWYLAFLGAYISIVKRDQNQSKSGKAPTFQISITPGLKVQFEAAAKAEGMSLGNWLKTLGRNELERLGIEPQDK